MLGADEIGTKATQLMMNNDYRDAVKILSEGISLYPDDHRFYTNRCNCYLNLKAYNEALMDAMFLNDNYPQYSKGYFLRGEIAMASKDFEEAERQFQQVASLVQTCEVERRLFDARSQQIVSKGHTIELAQKALRLSTSVNDALTNLQLGTITMNTEDSFCYYIPLTDEEEKFLTKAFEKFEGNSTATQIVHKPEPKQPVLVTSTRKDPLNDPSNPLKCKSLYIGNVSDAVTEKKLRHVFSKYGEIESTYLQQESKCAFINYKKPEYASLAMREMNGKCLENVNIFVRFPNNAIKKK